MKWYRMRLYHVPKDIVEDLNIHFPKGILICEECKKQEQEEYGFGDEHFEELSHPKKGEKCRWNGCKRTVE